MAVERKQLYRFILGAFRSNEDVERFLRDQKVYGDKLANAVPSPRVDREEYAFEVADRLVRWGYSSDYLEAVLADEDLGLQVRRNAAEMLGRDPWSVVESTGGTRTSQGIPANITPPGQRQPVPNHQPPLVNIPRPPHEEQEATEAWTLYVGGEERPTPEAVDALHRALCEQICGLRILTNAPVRVPLCAGYFYVYAAIPLSQLDWVRGGLTFDKFLAGWKLVAGHPRASDQSPHLHLVQTPSHPDSFQISKPGGFSHIVSQEIAPPSILRAGTNNAPENRWSEELRWYLEEYASEALEMSAVRDSGHGDDQATTRNDDEATTRKDAVERSLMQWTDDVFAKLTHHPLAKQWMLTATELYLSIAPESDRQSWPWECLSTARHVTFQNKQVLRTASPLGGANAAPDDAVPLPEHLRILLICPRAHQDSVGYRVVSENLLGLVRNAGGAVSLTELSPATPAALRNLANQGTQSFDIVHFDGHGLPDGQLMFEQSENQELGPFRADTLESHLARLGVKVVVMTACHSGAKTRRSLASSADTLVRTAGGGVAEVVAMGWQLHSDGARHFLNSFYREIFSGRAHEVTVAGAVRAGRLAMLDDPKRSQRRGGSQDVNDAIVPRHYIRHRVRFSSAQPSRARTIALPVGHDLFGVRHAESAPPCGLIGRDQELHQMVRWWTEPGLGCMVLQGPAGVGKRFLATWWLDRLAQTGLLGESRPGAEINADSGPHLLSATAADVDAFYLAICQQLNIPRPGDRALGCREIAGRLRAGSMLFWEGFPTGLADDQFKQLMGFARDLSGKGHRLVLICQQFQQHRQPSLLVRVKPFCEQEAVQFVGKIQRRPVALDDESEAGFEFSDRTYLPSTLAENVPAGERWAIGAVRRHAIVDDSV